MNWCEWIDGLPWQKVLKSSEAQQRQPKNQWRRLKWWSRKQLPPGSPIDVSISGARRWCSLICNDHFRISKVEGGICRHTIWGYYEKVERWESISSTEIGDWVWFEIFATINLTWIAFSIWTYLDNIWKIQMKRKQMMMIIIFLWWRY